MPEPSINPTLSESELEQPEQGQVMTGEAVQLADQPMAELEQPLVWQASEYVHHRKGLTWYIWLAVVMTALLAVAYIFKLWLSIGVFVAMGVAIAVYAHKPPRMLTYELDTGGITIEGKHYPYTTFRSFGVLSDASWHAIDLEPTQRFMPRLTVLFGDDDFDAIVSHLSLYLPRVDREPDLIERVTRQLRF